MGHHLDSAGRAASAEHRSDGAAWSGLAVVAGAVAGVVIMVFVLIASGLGKCPSLIDGIRVGHVLMSSRCE
jgi:hypothetical protein